MKILVNDIFILKLLKRKWKKKALRWRITEKQLMLICISLEWWQKTNKTAHFVINVCLVLLSIKLYYYNDFLVKNRFERLQGDLILFYFHAPMSLTSNNYYLFCYFFKNYFFYDVLGTCVFLGLVSQSNISLSHVQICFSWNSWEWFKTRKHPG